jgi:D-proline reductase (dithiol) PrdB
MARLEQLDEYSQTALRNFDGPEFDTQPWVQGPPLNRRRVAIISTAGLHRRGDRPFAFPSGQGLVRPADYRVIPGDTAADDLVMSHLSTNFDRTGFQQDWNVVFPLERLRELARNGVIGSVADFHYSFMGATDPRQMESEARRLSKLLKQDHVNAVLLVPV